MLYIARTGRRRHRIVADGKLRLEVEVVVQAVSPSGEIHFSTAWRRINRDDVRYPLGTCERAYARDMLSSFAEGWRAR